MKQLLVVLSVAVAVGYLIATDAATGLDEVSPFIPLEDEISPFIPGQPIMGCPEHRPSC
jgi:hypothetical protein